MLFSFYQFKTTIYVLFLASCLGQEQLHACEGGYCYERFIKRHTSDPNGLEVWHHLHNEHVERVQSPLRILNQNQRDMRNMRMKDRYVDRLTYQNHRFSEETLRKIPKTVGSQEFLIQSNDQHVIRGLNIRYRELQALRQLEEYRDVDRERLRNSESLRRFNNRVIEGSSEDRREEHRQRLEDLHARTNERDFVIHEDGRSARTTPEVQPQDIRVPLNEQELKHRYEDKRERVVKSDEIIRRIEDRKATLEFQRINVQCSDTQQCERKEVGKTSRRRVNNEDQREAARSSKIYEAERFDGSRIFHDYKAQDEGNRRELKHSRDENIGSCEDLHESARRFNNSTSLGASRRSEKGIDYKKFEIRETSRLPYEHISERRQGTLMRFGDSRTHLSRHLENYNHRDLEAQRFVARRSVDNREKHRHYESKREVKNILEIDFNSQRQFEHPTSNEPESMQQLDEIKREQEERHEFLRRFNYRKDKCDNNRRSINKERIAVLSSLETRQTRNTLHKQFPLRRYASLQRRDSKDDTRNSLRIIEHVLQKTRRHITEKESTERFEISNQFNNHNIDTRSDVNRETEHERILQRGHESIQRRDETSIGRLQTSRRFEVRKVQNDNRRRLEDEQEDRHSISKLIDERRVPYDITRRSDDNGNAKRIDARLSQSEQKSTQHRDEIVWKHLERHSEQHENRKEQNDFTTRLGNNHLAERLVNHIVQLEEEFRQQSDGARDTHRINRQIFQIEHRSENKRERLETSRRLNERDIPESSGDTSISLRNEEQLEKRNANRRLNYKHESRLANKRHDRVERDEEYKFIFNERNNNADYSSFAKGYVDKSVVSIKKSYMILGQGVILAYIIMKTLNGKNNFRHKLLTEFREAMELVGF